MSSEGVKRVNNDVGNPELTQTLSIYSVGGDFK
jgi:hypothetical protein